MKSKDQVRRGRTLVSNLMCHLVFVTKYRRTVIDARIWPTIGNAFASASGKLGCTIHEANHDGDHVHLIVEYAPALSISEMVNALKGVSSRMVRRDCMEAVRPNLWGEHFWSPSYFVCSCGGAPLEVVTQYVRSQRD